MPKFVVKQGDHAGTEIPMNGSQIVFGRSEECDVLVSDVNVSRRHAQAILINGLVAIVDLNSSNGTLVNGIPISRIFLMDGDEVRIGGMSFQFVDDLSTTGDAGAVRPSHASIGPSKTPFSGAFNSDSLPIPGTDHQDPLSHTRLFDTISEDIKGDTLKEIYLKLKSVYRIFHEVVEAGNLKEMFEAVGRGITLSSRIERVVFFLVADKTGEGFQRYFVHSSIRLEDKFVNEPEFMPIVERAKNEQKAILATKQSDGRWVIGEGEPNVLVIPLLKGGQVRSIMYVDNPSSLETISKNDVDFITTLALQLSVRLNQFEQVRQLSEENQQLRRSLNEDHAVVVQDEKMKQIMSVAARVAESDSTVLVTGESGAGKELIAQTVHRFSKRGKKVLVSVNCAALPETLLESELFGHEKGAFTGAVERRIGKFELADGGTLFLDEIGDISAGAQAKLLRVLQEGELQRVGGNKNIKVDVRLIAATNKNLLEEVQRGTFRQDLYFRLKVIEIALPPLRQRRDDIPALAEYFFKQLRNKINTPVKAISPECMQMLVNYPWPGNVRELRNVIERGLVFAFGEKLLPEHLPAEVLQHQEMGGLPIPESSGDIESGGDTAKQNLPFNASGEPLSLSEVERKHISFVLKFVKGNKLKAAQLLGISRTTLYEKLKLYEIEDEKA